MLNSAKWGGVALVVTAAAMSSGCATKSASAEYYKARQGSDLEIPPAMRAAPEDRSMVIPELAERGAATLSSYAGDCKTKDAREVLPIQQAVQIKRDDYRVWMQVNGSPAQVWPWVRDFWLSKGFEMEQDLPRLGMMQTNWMKYSEMRDGPEYKDQYRTRLEYAPEAGKTDIYLSLQRVQAVKERMLTRWVSARPDPEQEIEMVKRLALFLGVNAADIEKAQTSQVASQTEVLSDAQGYRRLMIRGNGEAVLQSLRDGMARNKFDVKQLESEGERLRFRVTIVGTDEAPVKPQQAWMESILRPSGKTTQTFYLEVVKAAEHIVVTPTDKQGRPLPEEAATKAIDELIKVK